jgi:hypothetical protein
LERLVVFLLADEDRRVVLFEFSKRLLPLFVEGIGPGVMLGYRLVDCFDRRGDLAGRVIHRRAFNRGERIGLLRCYRIRQGL